MLVLTRKCEERILIGPDIVITVIRIGGNDVKIGIDAPKDVAIRRDELEQPEAVEPTIPVRRIKVVVPGNENRGAVGRDVATGKRLNLCYFCGFPEDEHTPSHPQNSTTVIEE